MQGARNGYALVHLANGGKGPVELKIRLSFVSMANAKLNLDREIGDKKFDETRAEGHKT